MYICCVHACRPFYGLNFETRAMYVFYDSKERCKAAAGLGQASGKSRRAYMVRGKSRRAYLVRGHSQACVLGERAQPGVRTW